MAHSDSEFAGLPGWRRNNYAAMLALILVATTFSFTVPFLPLYVEQISDLSGPDAAMWAGIATGLGGFAMFVTGPFWGALGDRFGRKPMLIRALLGGAIGVLLLGFATSVWQVVVIRVFIGVMAGAGPAGMALVSAGTPSKQLAKYLGQYQASGMVGMASGPVIAAALISIWSYSTTFIIGGVLMFSGSIVAMILIKEPPRPIETHRVSARESFASVIKSPIASVALILVLVLSFAAPMVQPILPGYVVSLLPAGYESNAIIGWLFFGISVSSAIGAVYAGRILGRMTHRRLLLISTIGVAAFLFPVALVHGVPLLALFVVAMSFFQGLMQTGSASLLPTLVSATALSSIFGLYQSVQALSGQLGPAIGGIVAVHLGYRAVFAMSAVILLVLGLPMLAIFARVARKSHALQEA